MIKCTAKNCNSIENKDSSITFHKYPLFDKKLLKSWLENIAPPNYQPQSDDHVCSLHFTDNQFLNTEPRRLIRNAVPTLHTDGSNVNSSTARNTKSNIEYTDGSEESSEDSTTGSSDTATADEDSDYELTDTRKRKRKFSVPRYVGDFKEEDLKNPDRMKKMWELAYKQISEQKNKLRTITQRNRRLEGQVTRLKNVIKHLKSVHK